MPAINDFEERIRWAVSSGEFRTALTLWSDFSRTVEERAAARDLSPADLARARDLCVWTALTAKCARAHAHRRMSESQAAAQAAAAYRQAAQTHGWPTH